MAASSRGKTTSKLLFTLKQRRQLMKLLQEAAPHRNHDEALERMDRLAAKFKYDLKSVGFRPMIEILDRGVSSAILDGRVKTVRSFFSSGRVPSAWTRTEKLSPAGRSRQLLGIGKASDLLRAFVADVERCWEEATGKLFPRLPAEVVDRYYVGYGSELAVIAASHPLWLIFHAVEVKVGGMAVDELLAMLAEKRGEKI